MIRTHNKLQERMNESREQRENISDLWDISRVPLMDFGGYFTIQLDGELDNTPPP